MQKSLYSMLYRYCHYIKNTPLFNTAPILSALIRHFVNVFQNYDLSAVTEGSIARACQAEI